MLIKQSSSAKAIPFYMVDSTDHISAKTGLSPTVTISKNGAAFASPGGAVSEIGSGWYKVAGNATDSNTVGALLIHATATGADPFDIEHEVVVFEVDSATVTVGTNNDKTGYALTSAYDPAKTAASQTSVDSKASQSSVDTLSGYVDTEVAAILAAVDTEIGAIKAKTDQLNFTGTDVKATLDGEAVSVTISASDLLAISDAILKRDWTAVSGEAAYSLLNAARMLRNVWNTTGGTLSVKKEDGTTNAWTRTLSTDPTAQPIVGAT